MSYEDLGLSFSFLRVCVFTVCSRSADEISLMIRCSCVLKKYVFDCCLHEKDGGRHTYTHRQTPPSSPSSSHRVAPAPCEASSTFPF